MLFGATPTISTEVYESLTLKQFSVSTEVSVMLWMLYVLIQNRSLKF